MQAGYGDPAGGTTPNRSLHLTAACGAVTPVPSLITDQHADSPRPRDPVRVAACRRRVRSRGGSDQDVLANPAAQGLVIDCYLVLPVGCPVARVDPHRSSTSPLYSPGPGQCLRTRARIPHHEGDAHGDET